MYLRPLAVASKHSVPDGPVSSIHPSIPLAQARCPASGPPRLLPSCTRCQTRTLQPDSKPRRPGERTARHAAPNLESSLTRKRCSRGSLTKSAQVRPTQHSPILLVLLLVVLLADRAAQALAPRTAPTQARMHPAPRTLAVQGPAAVEQRGVHFALFT